jgi:hypothetical protein
VEFWTFLQSLFKCTLLCNKIKHKSYDYFSQYLIVQYGSIVIDKTFENIFELLSLLIYRRIKLTGRLNLFPETDPK